jgi:ketosteroid isomerase-like protein
MDIGQVIEQYHSGLHVFAVGDPEPIKAMYARSDDVLLANPFGGSSRGWDAVSQALDFASSNFRDGTPVRFKEVSRYVGADLVTLFEHEHWETKVGRRDEPSPFDLRVTTTFRLEGDGWQLVSRHADPLMTPHPDGPIRPTD